MVTARKAFRRRVAGGSTWDGQYLVPPNCGGPDVSPYTGYPTVPDLYLRWQLQGDANDSSGNARHGTLCYAAPAVPGFVACGPTGQVLHCAPDRGYGSGHGCLLSDLNLDYEDPLTIACWIKINTPTGTGQGLIGYGYWGSQQSFSLLSYSGDAKLSLHNAATEITHSRTEDALWHHYAMVKPASSGYAALGDCQLYVDGGAVTLSASASQLQFRDSSVLGLGFLAGLANNAYSPDADYSDFRAYLRALTGAQVLQIRSGVL